MDEPVSGNPAHVETIPVSVTELARLRQQDTRAKQLESAISDATAKSAIAEATASIPWVSDTAAAHARALLQGRVIVRPDHEGNLQAFDRVTGLPASEALRNVLSSNEFAMYRRASHQGGVLSPGGGPTPSNPSAPLTDGPGINEEARRLAMFGPLVTARGGNLEGRSMGNPLGHRRR